MDDLISRQAAISHVDDVPYIKEHPNVGLLWEAWIESLPSAQPEQRWIPWDSGKFPEESGTYTVTAYDGATKRVTYAKYQKRLKRWELTGARAYWRVLAWQPKPKPWEGDADADHD